MNDILNSYSNSASHTVLSRVISILALILLLAAPSQAQFSPIPGNTTNCPPNACVPGCSNGGGTGGNDCTGLFCPPSDCNAAIQSCINDPNPDPDTDPRCEGSDCGDNDQCPANNNTAANGSGAQNTSTANPINLISGNKYKRQEDLPALPGTLGLEFTRHYNSFISGNMGLGKGWRHSYATALQAPQGFAPGEAEYVRIQQSDGRIMRFHRVGSRNSKTQYATRNHADGFITTTEYGYQWRWRNGRMLSFDDRGLMTQIEQGQQRLTLSYSNGGQLLSVTDPQGRRLSLQYAQGLLIQITDPAGQETKYRYSYDKQLVKVIRPTGKERVYHYQDETRGWLLTGITDERGIRVESYGYDEHGRATVSTKGENTEKVSIEYEDGQRVVTNGLGESTVYVLGDVNGQKVIEEVRGPGCSACEAGDVAYQYNDALQVTKVEYKNGSAELFEYDARGRMVAHHRRMAAGFEQRLVARYGYEGSSHRPSLIERESVKPGEYHRTQMTYTADGQLASVKETGFAPATPLNLPQGGDDKFVAIERVSQMRYDAKGQLVLIDGPRNDVQDFLQLEHDQSGRLSAVYLPDGQIQKVLSYDASGRPTKIQTGQQQPVLINYNSYGKPTLIQYGELTIRYSYNERGDIIRITDPDGSNTNIEYDISNRIHKINQDNGPAYEISLDDESRVLESKLFNAKGEILQTISYLQDAQARLKKQQEQYVQQARFSDANQAKTSAPFSRLLLSDNPGDIATIAHWDNTGKPVALSDDKGNHTYHIRDDFDRIVTHKSEDTGITHNLYDSAGNITQSLSPSGQTTLRSYDGANRLIRQETADDVISLTYDKNNGRLASIQNTESTDTFSFDINANLIEHTRVIDKQRFTTQYSYDSRNRLLTKTLPDGQTLRYHYYDHGGMRAVTRDDWFGLNQTELLTELDDNHWDGETQIGFGNGLLTTRQYNRQGQVSRINTSDKLNFRYQYDESGNIIGIDYNGDQYRYDYDKHRRLTIAQTPSLSFQYEYDETGNQRRRQTVASNGAELARTSFAVSDNGEGNRLVAINENTIAYNAEGSTVNIRGAMGMRQYEYNSQQRPVKLFIDGQLVAEYAYNGFGERVKKVVYSNGKKRGKVTYFLYDGHSLTAEADAKGKILRQYIYHGEQPAVQLQGRTAYFLHTDHLGTPRAATDKNQQIVWQADYTPFGKAEILRNEIKVDLRFPGQYHDKESGTYYNYLRDYDPETGRYLTSDPIGLAGGVNTYAYVNGNPINRIDPIGLESEMAGPDAGSWLQRIIIGNQVHSMFTNYVTTQLEYSGWGANDTLNGVFGNRRPDAYNYLTNEIWELKPISQRDAERRGPAERQIADYVRLATRTGLDVPALCSPSWRQGSRTRLFEQGQLLGYTGYLGIVWEIRLYYDDPEHGDSGLVFYSAEQIRNPVAEVASEILRELARNPWVLLPPRRRPPQPVPVR